MTTASPERSSSPTDPSSKNHESTPKHSPYVEAPPGRPPIERHGQITSQLHDSKSEPRTSQSPKSIIAASCRLAETGGHNHRSCGPGTHARGMTRSRRTGVRHAGRG